jgi:hypothetical protein
MNKKTVAKVIGAGVVGVAGAFVLKEMVGRAAGESIAGAIVLLMLHEVLDAPVSTWVYKQI